MTQTLKQRIMEGTTSFEGDGIIVFVKYYSAIKCFYIDYDGQSFTYKSWTATKTKLDEIISKHGMTEVAKDEDGLTPAHLEALELIKDSTANIWSHPKGPRGGKDDVNDCCEYCGKRSKDGEGNYFQILTDGTIIPNSINEQIVWDLHNAGKLSAQPQGCFSIGATCAKKLLGKKLELYL